jgi:hypothetical protein
MGQDWRIRIVSLLPSATEIVYTLGLEAHLVGITDECDWPPQARTVQVVSSRWCVPVSVNRVWGNDQRNGQICMDDCRARGWCWSSDLPAASGWSIENGLHWVTFTEDASQVRSGTAPQVMACLRNLAIGLLCRAGPVNLAAALRFHSRDPHRPLATLGISLGVGHPFTASRRRCSSCA